MTDLFGRKWDKAALLERVGNVRQLGGAQSYVLEDGPWRGVRAIDVRTGTGLVFTVLPDRGMDVWRTEFQGASLAWHSPTGPVAPAFFEPEGFGWLRGFYGGMLVTCGLTYLGPPGRDEGAELGLHGRASYAAATEVGISQEWDRDEYEIEIRGKIREAAVFGENIVLSRRIRTRLGSNSWKLQDEVENEGHESAPHMILYHVNAGFPALDETSELLTPTVEATGADAEAEKEKKDLASFRHPQAGCRERCYFHKLRTGIAALVNRKFQGGRGIGYCLRWNLDELPCFTEWKMMGAGLYVVGTEPGNVQPAPRAELRRRNTLPVLGPGEKRRYEIEFEALASSEDIARVEREVRS